MSFDIFGAFAIWIRSMLIHFGGLGLSRALLQLFLRSSIHFLFV